MAGGLDLSYSHFSSEKNVTFCLYLSTAGHPKYQVNKPSKVMVNNVFKIIFSMAMSVALSKINTFILLTNNSGLPIIALIHQATTTQLFAQGGNISPIYFLHKYVIIGVKKKQYLPLRASTHKLS